MNNEGNNFRVNSSWTVNEESVSLEEIISVEDVKNSEWLQLTEEEMGNHNLNNDENFALLHLTRRNKNESCTLTIDLEDPSVRITKIIIITEAKMIELFGKHGEYICTEKANLLGCFNGKKFYISQPNIAGTKEVTLKFHESGDTLWLYGITLLVVRNIEPPSKAIDFANVDQILQSSNIHLTENAERAKAFIMNYNLKKNKDHDDSETLQDLLQKWNALSGNKTSEIISTPLITNFSNNASVVKMENGNKECDSDLKHYVDRKLEQLEERMQNKLQTQLKEFEQKQNEKLDNIIELIQKKM